MSSEKQIEEMTADLCAIECKGMKCDNCDHYGCEYRLTAEALYNMGYRKIYDDHQRQCTCYALGCQMAERLYSKVARKIFEEIEKIIEKNKNKSYLLNTPLWSYSYRTVEIINGIAELKNKYTEDLK